ncbi:MAG: RsmD family RNA methyltransferase [Planctomycetota bacterium]
MEALSRGAESCVFVEKDPRLARLAMENAERCKLADRCELVQADVLDLPGCPSAPAVLPGDLVFVDPPYALVDDPNGRASLFRALEDLGGSWVADGAVVVLHHRPIPHAVWPTERLREWDKRIYGQSQITFFETSEGGDG